MISQFKLRATLCIICGFISGYVATLGVIVFKWSAATIIFAAIAGAIVIPLILMVLAFLILFIGICTNKIL